MRGSSVIIRRGRLVTPEGIQTGDLLIENGVIAAVGSAGEAPGAEVIDAAGDYVAPGFVNLHVHGGVGFDATSGLFDARTRRFNDSEGRFREMLPEVAAHFARHGVTRALLATVAAEESKLERALGFLADYVESDANGSAGTRIDGVFLEGTFIKNPDFSGAQNPAHFTEPSIEPFDRLNDAARGSIRYALVAPEWGESALALVRALAERGVMTGAGHTDCTALQYRAAVENGMTMAVHLTNGPTGSSTKPFGDGGALEEALKNDAIFTEVIMDGWHVHPGYVMDIIARKHPERCCLVTDAMFATGAEGIGEFEVEGVRGKLSENGEYLCVVGKKNTLFGSVLTMSRGFQNLVNWLAAGLPGVWTGRRSPLDADSAVAAACRLASANPARAMGLCEPSGTRKKAECLGSLEVGKQADVAVLKIEGQPGSMTVDVKRTLIRGSTVFSQE